MDKKLDDMCSDELKTELNKKQESLNVADTANEVLELEEARISEKITSLTLERKPIQYGLIQGKHNVSRLRGELKIIDRLMWKKLKEEKGGF